MTPLTALGFSFVSRIHRIIIRFAVVLVLNLHSAGLRFEQGVELRMPGTPDTLAVLPVARLALLAHVITSFR